MTYKVESLKSGVNGLGIVHSDVSSFARVSHDAGFKSKAILGGSRKMSNMKNMIAIGALALCATVYGIESNIVGYDTKEAFSIENSENHTYNMVAVPFTGIGTGFQLSDFKVANGTMAMNIMDADVVMIWDPTMLDGNGGYENWFCWNGEDPDSGDVYDEYAGSWASDEDCWTWFEDVHEDGLEAGSTFWLWLYNKDGAHATTVSGAVLDDSSKTIEYFYDKYNMVTDPFPVRLNLNDAEQVEFTTAVQAMNIMDADQILIWDPTALDGIGAYENWFCWNGEDPDSGDVYDEYAGNWASDEDCWTWFEDVHAEGMDVGTAFWYIARGTYSLDNKGSITFFGPLAK